MVESKRSLLIIANGISVWRDRRFIRWWTLEVVVNCASIAGGFVFVICLTLFGIDRDIGYQSWLPLQPWSVHALVSVCFVALYLLFFLPLYCLEGWQQKKAMVRRLRKKTVQCRSKSKQFTDVWNPDSSYSQAREQAMRRCYTTDEIPAIKSLHRQDLSELVRQHYSLYSEAWMDKHNASPIIENGRTNQPAQPPMPAELVTRVTSAVATGEVEPITLPVVVFRWKSVAAMIGLFMLASLSATVYLLSDLAWWVGDIISVYALFLGYAAMRELGFCTLPLFRGECSIEKTRVFHGFRWKTFRPGRDLAILRFTSNCEADIAFLGADGSHATARVGGKYLNHFIACWAAPR